MTRIYEMRTYLAEPGRSDALHARFREHTLDLFERHGMDNIGYWVSTEDPDTLVYLLAHTDRDAAEASWRAFRSDPQWQTVKAESEQDGPLVRSITSVFLTPTDFSQLR